MATTQKLRNKLMAKLTELFQLDQPDLDFGFYRIMQAKSAQITSFIDKDLLKIIEDAFGQVDESRKAELQANIQKEIEAAKEYGVADPENSPKVLAAKAKYDALKEGATAEADVYDHLYRFFERYYDEGDFISRRYYARENAGKAAPFAIPYNGEEVKLHWANADQYYIKTAEYFTNFTFDLAKAKEVVDNQKSTAPLDIPESLKVHFRILDASEGEHGNVKAAEDKKRFFILHEENPVEFNDANELVINFEYKALPGGKNDVDDDTETALKEKFGKSLNKGDMPNLAIAKKVIEVISGLENAKSYFSALSLLAPTDKIENRPLLAKYINQYTARNTCDYFIHKDLAGFLKRELDFYIKNEVMHLDDIENADAPAVENYLAKLKVIRKIANKLIDFLAQLENFQKKLWLKKKFVTETNYCITLDRVPQELYEEIANNEAQREEWVKLFAIDEITATDGDLVDGSAPGYSVSLTVEFLKANDKLVLDTAFFSDDFKAKLIASIEDFDEECDGLLIHSENFQALNLLQKRYQEQVKCVYIDPPYNTGDDGFSYKDNYQHASWMSMMAQSLGAIHSVMSKASLLFCSIDRDENMNLLPLFFELWGEENFIEEIVWQKAYGGGSKTKLINNLHEYIISFSKNKQLLPKLWLPPKAESQKYYKHSDEKVDTRGKYRTQPLYTNSNDYRENLTFPLPVPSCKQGTKEWNQEMKTIQEDVRHGRLFLVQESGAKWKYLIKKDMEELLWDGTLVYPPKQWQWSWDKAKTSFVNNELVFSFDGENWSVDYKQYQFNDDGEERGTKPSSILIGPYTQTGTDEVWNYFGYPAIKFPKPTGVIKNFFAIDYTDSKAIMADFFAGSGTSGDVIINLNRELGGNRKFILTEMGDYFDTVTKPRISKVIYSSDWKNGKPTSRDAGVSHCFKYIRLESYEDTLNNLAFDSQSADSSVRKNAQVRDKALEASPSLKEDYMLHYLLDVETRGSQSLLNIDAFADPTSYSLVVKKPGSDEQVQKNIDLIETFNYLLGLRLEHMDAPQTFTASFTRKPDPELPKDQHTKLVVDGKIQLAADGKWWFRKLEGWVPADPMNPNNGQKEKVLIVWRKLTGNLEEDNLMLDEWFKKYRISSRESAKFDVIYVNGSNNLPNLKKDEERWKVRLIEEDFHKLMWAVEGEA